VKVAPVIAEGKAVAVDVRETGKSGNGVPVAWAQALAGLEAASWRFSDVDEKGAAETGLGARCRAKGKVDAAYL